MFYVVIYLLNVLTPFQICYGIIYGIGAKSLGEQMGVKENDAACYIDSFKSRYTGEKLSTEYLLNAILFNPAYCIRLA
jgi:hypothetical protein